MHKIQRMDPSMGPPNCLICRRGNTPDDPDTMDEFWVLDIERDYNWGDPAYICKYCADRIARECGNVPLHVVEEKDAIIAQKNKEIHNAESERDSLKRRLRSITHGSKALKSTKKQIA